MDLRPILYVTGILLCTLAASMIFPILTDLSSQNPDWKVFFFCMSFTGFIGGALILMNTGRNFNITVRQTFLLTTVSWVAISLAGAAPFALSGLDLSIADAVFESISGITTTGSTVITQLDAAPPGILLWRAILQWLGGIGIIVMALSVLPFLKVGGMQLFQTESSEKDKALPRATQVAAAIGTIYLALTVLCMLGYRFSGMNDFNAWTHAMTTISTGGFSTSDKSFAAFDNIFADLTAMTFMTLGALPFILFVKAVHGNWKTLFKDTQVRTFLGILGAAIFITMVHQVVYSDFPFWTALRYASFNIISIGTGTGYVNNDYSTWGGMIAIIAFFLTAAGGCAGSASCGIKTFRFQILYSVMLTQIKKLIHPHGVFTPHYNHHPLPDGIALSVMSFFFVYAASFSVLAIGLSLTGLDFTTAMSGSVTTLSNVGPGLGNIIGPTGTFQPLPDTAKWMMCVGMILGRLELFTVLVLLMPSFWHK